MNYTSPNILTTHTSRYGAPTTFLSKHPISCTWYPLNSSQRISHANASLAKTSPCPDVRFFLIMSQHLFSLFSHVSLCYVGYLYSSFVVPSTPFRTLVDPPRDLPDLPLVQFFSHLLTPHYIYFPPHPTVAVNAVELFHAHSHPRPTRVPIGSS